MTRGEVRRAISAHLRKKDVTQAQYHTDRGPKNIAASQLQSFRGKKGPNEGNTSSAFYAAYCFFEKIRIKDGKAKSERRKKMEEVWGSKGFDIETPSNRGYVCDLSSLPLLSELILSISVSPLHARCVPLQITRIFHRADHRVWHDTYGQWQKMRPDGSMVDM